MFSYSCWYSSSPTKKITCWFHHRKFIIRPNHSCQPIGVTGKVGLACRQRSIRHHESLSDIWNRFWRLKPTCSPRSPLIPTRLPRPGPDLLDGSDRYALMERGKGPKYHCCFLFINVLYLFIVYYFYLCFYYIIIFFVLSRFIIFYVEKESHHLILHFCNIKLIDQLDTNLEGLACYQFSLKESSC